MSALDLKIKAVIGFSGKLAATTAEQTYMHFF
jgi:hypothetical protein